MASDLQLWDIASDPAHPKLAWSEPSKTIGLTMTARGAIFALEEPGNRFVVYERSREQVLGRIGPIDFDYSIAVLSPDGRLLANRWRIQPGDRILGCRLGAGDQLDSVPVDTIWSHLLQPRQSLPGSRIP